MNTKEIIERRVDVSADISYYVYKFENAYTDELKKVENGKSHLSDSQIKEQAIEATKDFVRTTGIGVGISSGAAIAGAKKVAAKYPDKKIVTILPDGVDKYLSMLDFEEVTYVEV